jgi:hypothetical protein
MLNVVSLIVIMMNVIMLNVVAPFKLQLASLSNKGRVFFTKFDKNPIATISVKKQGLLGTKTPAYSWVTEKIKCCECSPW